VNVTAFPFPGIGILFEIEKLGGSYGDQAWRIFMRHVSSDELSSCILVEGDTLAAKGPLVNLFCIGIYGLTVDVRAIRDRFEQLDEPGLAPMPTRTVEKPALDVLPLPIRCHIDGFGRMVTDHWTRLDHDLCKESGWAYAPTHVPPDLDERLQAELNHMKLERPLEFVTRGPEDAGHEEASPPPSQAGGQTGRTVGRQAWRFWKRN